MKPRLLLASTALALAAFAGSVQADLIQDLNTMPAEQALSKAMQDGSQSIEAVISAAATTLQGQPELLSALIAAAVKTFPEQAAQLVSIAVFQAPNLSATIVNAALAVAEGDATMQASINRAATDAKQLVQTQTTETEAENVEVEQTEAPASQIPPPPPSTNSGSNDRPAEVSPN